MSENTPPDRSSPRTPHETTTPAQAQRTPPIGDDRPNAPVPQQPPQWWTQMPTQAKKSSLDWFPIIRLAWASLMLIVLLVTWGSGPEGQDWQGEVSSAGRIADINNGSAEGAPQQQVVNGWHAADLTEIQINQNSALLEQQGHNATLLLVLGLGIFGDLAIRALNDRPTSRRQPAPDAPQGLRQT